MATFRISQDQENRGPNVRKTQQEPSQQQRRAVLGVLNKNTNRVPLQKPQQDTSSGDENICPKQKVTSQVFQKAPFKIHEEKLIEEKAVVLRDSKDHVSDISSKLKSVDLPGAVTSLHRQPLQEISVRHDFFEEDSTGGSPMSLDRSGILSTPVKQKSKSAQELLLDVDEYREEIYLYLREAEARHRPKPGYMKKQPYITYSMRSVLVDWLVEVAEEYHLQTETLYLAVSYIDRFLSFMSVVHSKLQLVGTAAMFIAA
ncbi:hypothetical protein B7P43_G17983 [Cryptotermes secundus]|nr:hypothetical protein B7P43_G17983 [Cryptotermes secundus]